MQGLEVSPLSIVKTGWKREFLGKPTSLWFHKDAVYAASSMNAIGAIQVDSGNLRWRQVLHQDDQLHSIKGHGTLLALASISGITKPVVRLWNLQDGSLVWESTISSETIRMEEGPKTDLLFIRRSKDTLEDVDYVAALFSNTVVVLNARNGAFVFQTDLDMYGYSDAHAMRLYLEPASGSIRVTGFSSEKTSLVWWNIKWKQEGSVRPSSSQSFRNDIVPDFEFLGDGTVALLKGFNELVICSPEKVFSISLKDFTPSKTTWVTLHNADYLSSSFFIKFHHNRQVLSVIAFNPNGDGGFVPTNVPIEHEHTRAFALSAFQLPKSKKYIWTLIEQRDGKSIFKEFKPMTAKESFSVLRVDEFSFPTYQFGEIQKVLLALDSNGLVNLFVSSQDMSLSKISQFGTVQWTRSEALATIVDVQLVDVPHDSVAMLDADDEHFPGFFPRVIAQFQWLSTFASQFLSSMSDLETMQSGFFSILEELVEGESPRFGAHKRIIALSDSGKIFGISAVDGSIAWSLYLPAKPSVHQLFLSKAHSLHPEVTVISPSRIFQIDVRSGTILRQSPVSSVKQVLPLSKGHHEIELVGISSDMDVVPLTLKENLKWKSPVYFQQVSIGEDQISGFEIVKKEQSSAVQLVWRVVFPGEVIVNAFQPSLSSTSMQSVFLQEETGKRLKFAHPNMISVATEGANSSFIKIYNIDSVTGNLVHVIKHTDCSGPVHLTRAENALYYHYWSDKGKRYQVSVIEFFALNGRPSNTFSSFDNVEVTTETQTFASEFCIRSISVTSTTRGVTPRSVLFGLCSGQVSMIPATSINPRRALESRSPNAEENVSGVLPYKPWLSSSRLNFISGGAKVERLSQIVSSDAELESSSIVLAVGLDLLLVQVTPAQAFDYLNDEFNLPFLLLTAGGVFAAILITSSMANSKRISMAWA